MDLEFTEAREEKLNKAIELLEQALDLIDDATINSPIRAVAESYTIPSIENVLGRGNPYTSGTITELIERIAGDAEDEEDFIDEDEGDLEDIDLPRGYDKYSDPDEQPYDEYD